MAYCSNCGEKISDDTCFCPKCGTKTLRGKASNVPYPSDELREAFYSVGVELEKALNLAAHETQIAFQRVKQNLQREQTRPRKTVCSKCATKNSREAIFCYNCGTKISSTKEP